MIKKNIPWKEGKINGDYFFQAYKLQSWKLIYE